MSNEVEKQLAYESLESKLSDICKTADYSELWGYDLLAFEPKSPVKEKLLRKFLVANNYDESGTEAQLTKCLKWRKEFNPLSAAFAEQHKPEFQSLGVITRLPTKKVVTWNLYGAVKNRQELFGDKDGFLRWRVGLMERGIALMELDSPNENLAYVTQIHDYMDVSFFRLDSETKAATKATIAIFQDYYPEMLDAKYFVNVPLIMGWLFGFMKAFMPSTTAAKFHVVTNGKDLAKDLDENIPSTYGGKTEALAKIKINDVEPQTPSLVERKAAEPSTTTENETPVVAHDAELGTAKGDDQTQTDAHQVETVDKAAVVETSTKEIPV